MITSGACTSRCWRGPNGAARGWHRRRPERLRHPLRVTGEREGGSPPASRRRGSSAACARERSVSALTATIRWRRWSGSRTCWPGLTGAGGLAHGPFSGALGDPVSQSDRRPGRAGHEVDIYADGPQPGQPFTPTSSDSISHRARAIRSAGRPAAWSAGAPRRDSSPRIAGVSAGSSCARWILPLLAPRLDRWTSCDAPRGSCRCGPTTCATAPSEWTRRTRSASVGWAPSMSTGGGLPRCRHDEVRCPTWAEGLRSHLSRGPTAAPGLRVSRPAHRAARRARRAGGGAPDRHRPPSLALPRAAPGWAGQPATGQRRATGREEGHRAGAGGAPPAGGPRGRRRVSGVRGWPAAGALERARRRPGDRRPGQVRGAAGPGRCARDWRLPTYWWPRA